MDSLKAYPHLPSILILNKIDVLKSKRITLELIRLLTNNTLTGPRKQIKSKKRLEAEDKDDKDMKDDKDNKDVKAENTKEAVVEFGDLNKSENSWSNFSEVFLVSSITGNGLNDVHVSQIKDF